MSVGAGLDAANQQSKQAYKKGYSIPSQLREEIKKAHQTCLRLTVTVAVVDVVTVAGSAIVTGIAVARLPWWTAGLLALVGVVLIGRQLRGLENLVHEGSHFNWSRQHRRLNDALTRIRE